MRSEFVRLTDSLHRSVWTFSLTSSCIYFDYYSEEYKDNIRQRKWRRSGHWDRLFQRDSSIKDPPLPKEVEAEARDFFAHCMYAVDIVK